MASESGCRTPNLDAGRIPAAIGIPYPLPDQLLKTTATGTPRLEFAAPRSLVTVTYGWKIS